MNSDATHDATHATLWLSVAQAAQAEGVSVRAVQRRCSSGKYRSRRAQTPQGERLEVDAATLTTHATQRRDADDDSDATPATQRRDARDDEPEQRRDTRDARRDGEGSSVPNRRADDEAERLRAEVERERREREQDREEIRFLRLMVESLTQSEAQTKAALREALKAMPRQLETSGKGAGLLQTKAPLNSNEEEMPTNIISQMQKNTTQQKEPRPLWKLIFGIR